jgi:hypothetical protein
VKSLLALAFVVLIASSVAAHPLAPGLLEVRAHADGSADVVWTTPVLQPSGESPLPMLPTDCRPLAAPVLTTEDARLVQRWRVRCPGGWVGAALGMRGIEAAATATLVRVTLADGHVATSLLTADRPLFTIPPRPTATTVMGEYLALGMEHLLTGVDHLLFVLGLVFVVERRRTLVTTVTAFTLGHSATLALAVLGLVAVPTAPIEAAIAASIAVLAAEIVAAARGQAGVLSRRPWTMAFAFGLLHGFGFAGALAETGVPAGEIPLALVSFNAGIELGQLAVVAVACAAQALLGAMRWQLPRGLRLAPAYGMGSIAVVWCLERLAPVVRGLVS